MQREHKDVLENPAIAIGWTSIAAACEVSTVAARQIAERGELPVAILAGKPFGNLAMLHAFAARRREKRARIEQRKAALDSQRAALEAMAEA